MPRLHQLRYCTAAVYGAIPSPASVASIEKWWRLWSQSLDNR